MPEFHFTDRYHDRPIRLQQAEFPSITDALDYAASSSPPVHLGNIEFAGHDMTGIPVATDLDRRILKAIRDPRGGFCYDEWHKGNRHCRGGWAIHLAGDEGRRLEERYGPKVAASLIYAASCPGKPVPSSYLDEPSAVEDMESRIAS